MPRTSPGPPAAAGAPRTRRPTARHYPAAAVLDDQVPGIGGLIRRPVTAVDRAAAAIGVHDTQLQDVAGWLPTPPPVAAERVVPARLVLAAHAHVSGELESVRVGADTADPHRHLPGADQHQLAGYRPGNYLIWLHPGRAAPWDRLGRRRRLRDRVEKAHVSQPAIVVGDLRTRPRPFALAQRTRPRSSCSEEDG